MLHTIWAVATYWIMLTSEGKTPWMMGPYPSIETCRMAGHEAIPRERQFMTPAQVKVANQAEEEIQKWNDDLSQWEAAIRKARPGIYYWRGVPFRVEKGEVVSAVQMPWVGGTVYQLDAAQARYMHDRSPYRALTSCLVIQEHR